MKIISSRGNPLYKSLLRLKTSPRERRIRQAALLEGPHLIAAHLERAGQPRRLAVSASARQNAEVGALLRRAASLEPVVFADVLFRELSSVTMPPGILAEFEIPRVLPVPSDADCCLMLEDIQDPGNLGSMLRSAAAAGVSHALLSLGCADAWSPRVLRAAMGAHFFINVVERADLPAFARSYTGQVIALMAHAGRWIFDIDLTRPTAFIAGNEGAGLSRELSSEVRLHAGIPMPGGTESINVGAAAAVCLFERVRQRKAMRGD